MQKFEHALGGNIPQSIVYPTLQYPPESHLDKHIVYRCTLLPMLFHRNIAAIILWLATIAFSSPTNITATKWAWATFYDDENCRLNPGRAVNMANPGCLNEAGRKSFSMRNINYFPPYLLIVSPTNNCPCQSSCRKLDYKDEHCIRLRGHLVGSSYRFLSDATGRCPANQC